MLILQANVPTPLAASGLEGVPVFPARARPAEIAPAAPPPSAATVAATVARANHAVQAIAPALEFEIDPDTATVIVRLVDTQDGRVLRQIPTEEMLEIAKALDRVHGLLVQDEA